MNTSRATRSASAQRGSSSKCQQTTTPGDHEQAVDERVQQRAEARVLAGDARGDPVEVVAPADDGEEDRRQRVGAVVRAQREHEEDRDQREPDEADRVRDRPRRAAAAPGSVCGGGGPERSRPDRRRKVRRARSTGASATAPPTASAAPSQRDAALDSAPAPHLRLELARTRASAGRPSAAAGTPSSSASANFSPGPRVAVVVEDVQARARAARRRAARPASRSSVPGLPRPTSWTSNGASDARPGDARARRRTARPRRRRCAPGRCRRSPSRSGCSVPGLVEVGRAERLGVARAELEDVADLDRGLDPDRVAVDGVARLDRAHVGAREREVAAGLDAAQVRVRRGWRR